ncbi:hypothetical protein AAG570_000724 [Ranatra chinensis]|uniref:DRBM domain-containing protein n=1 Tax=Ranatra chinensis TaxID=642074 RepID=A0ABD0YYL4_9HEMI
MFQKNKTQETTENGVFVLRTVMAEKTPVMRLSELITKLHETCKFELIHSEPTKPWFEYEAIACNKRATGAAMSKKKAKQEAAKHLLNMIGGFTRQKSKLDCVDSPREMDCVTVRTESQAQKNMLMTTNIYMPQKPGETGCVTSIAEVGRREPIVSMSTTFINSVGSLQELCAQSDYPMPSYKLLDSRGPPHCGIFTISCSVANCSELGTGRTKKEAKHAAAQNVFQALTNQDESDNLSRSAKEDNNGQQEDQEKEQQETQNRGVHDPPIVELKA